ncbi:MAG TPA: Rieske 2Fe-2S domain-containing protein [Ktedonobacterales bacterium]|nr:Rieske 2Fe-2S domain-containing protein [Ktedonobacterales bacterium]
MKVPLCNVDEIPEEGAKAIDFFGREALVVKVNGTPKAIMSTCLHLGGPLHCEENKLVCAWHGAEFALDDGRRLKGPVRADARLMVLPTRIEDGVLSYVWGE